MGDYWLYDDLIHLACENPECPSPYSRSLTPTQFSDEITFGDFACPTCGRELSISGLNLRCYICGADIEYDSVIEIQHWLSERCPYCAGSKQWDADFYSIVVGGSWSDLFSTYNWGERGKSPRPLRRKNRTDYWEGLVHFCSAEEFISIYKERNIRAEPTGLYGKRNPDGTRAVCLSEAPQSNWDEIELVHGEYGFVFRKRDVIALKGAPTVYLPQVVIDDLKTSGEKIPRKLWPYLSKLKISSVSADGAKHDFLHEREWRVPQDIDFEVTRPFAVTFPKRRPRIEDEELILVAAREFQELSACSDEEEDQE